MEHQATVIAFGPFRLAPDKRELWKDEALLKVRALPLAVLTYLAQHPERVIAVEELRKAVWGGTRVGRGAVRVCVREIRQALGDEAATPRYVETVGRQGYRFIGGGGGLKLETSLPSPQVSSPQSPVSNFVGRQRELTQLQQWFAQAQQGQRQVVLVSGEPGIGKTTLVEAFLQRLESKSDHRTFVHSRSKL
jgi:DNA-binding winged helix-turn-helix (wHTH) protein